jgi:hypothetical protein
LWSFLSLFVTALLLFAAGMKGWQIAAVQNIGGGLFHQPLFNLFIVLFELTFAAWLVTGLFPKQAWVATISLFTLFGLVSFGKALSRAGFARNLSMRR